MYDVWYVAYALDGVTDIKSNMLLVLVVRAVSISGGRPPNLSPSVVHTIWVSSS